MSTNPYGDLPINRIEDKRIGFGPRVVAAIIDGLATAVMTMVLTFLLMQYNVQPVASIRKTLDAAISMYEFLGFSQDMISMLSTLIPAAVLAGMISGIVYTLIEGLTGASPGKRVMKIVVARLDGHRGDTGLFVRRWAIKQLDKLLAFAALIPGLLFLDTVGNVVGMILFIGCLFVLGYDRLALHDRIVQSAVYHRDDVLS